MAKRKRQTIPVSTRALVQRVNRKLAKDNEQIRATRAGTRARVDLGEYYQLRFGRTASEPSTNIIDTQVDLAQLGRELGVLESWERLED
jgi:hypothetical protein